MNYNIHYLIFTLVNHRGSSVYHSNLIFSSNTAKMFWLLVDYDYIIVKCYVFILLKTPNFYNWWSKQKPSRYWRSAVMSFLRLLFCAFTAQWFRLFTVHLSYSYTRSLYYILCLEQLCLVIRLKYFNCVILVSLNICFSIPAFAILLCFLFVLYDIIFLLFIYRSILTFQNI